MANASVSYDSELPDVDGQVIRCTFQGVTIAAREVKSVTLTSGSAASGAILPVPFLAIKADEVAFNIALKASGPAAALKLLARAQFDICDINGKNTLPILCGFMLQRHHIFYESGTFDRMDCNVLDDKWPMTKYRIIGRYEYDPETKAHYYNSGGRCIFNHNGFRSCLDTPFGPRFSAKDNSGYNGNYSGEISQEPAPGYATTTPRTWRPVDVAQYHLDTKFASRLGTVPKSQYFMGDQQIGKYLVVPRGIENILTDRPIRDVDHDGQNVLDALVDILRRAGSFDLDVKPRGGFTSELAFIDANPIHHFPIYLPGYTVNTVAAAMGARNLVKAGSLLEDASARYPAVNLMGDAPAVEFFASTDTTGTGAGLLDFDWPHIELQAYTQYMERNDSRGGVKNSFTRFEGANEQYSRPFAAYRIKDGADIFANTKYAGVRIGGKTPLLMATQLTADNTGNKPAGWQPKPIIVEYKMTDAEFAAAQLQYPTITNLSPWVPCLKADGLTLSPDGKTLFLPQLRAQGQTWYTEPARAGDPPHPTYGSWMNARQIRLNVAVEGDFPAFCLNATDPNRVAPRFDGAAPKFTLQMRAGPLAFVDWERIAASRPVGEGAIDQDVSIFPHKAEAGNELFSDFSGPAGAPVSTSRASRMTAAKINDVNRIILKGNLDFIGLNGVIRPGYPVQLAGDVMDGVSGMVKAVTYDVDSQTTRAVFGSNDVSTLFEMNGAPMPRGGGGSSISSAPPPSKSEDPYSTPKTPDQPSDSYKQESAPKGPDTSKMDDYEKADAAKRNGGGQTAGAATPAQSAQSGGSPGAQSDTSAPSTNMAVVEADQRKANLQAAHDKWAESVGPNGEAGQRKARLQAAHDKWAADPNVIRDQKAADVKSGKSSTDSGSKSSSETKGSGVKGGKESYADYQKRHPVGGDATPSSKPAAPPPKAPPPAPKAPAAPAKAAPAPQQNLSIPNSKPSAPRPRSARPPEDE